MNAGAQLPLEVPRPSARLERAARHARRVQKYERSPKARILEAFSKFAETS